MSVPKLEVFTIGALCGHLGWQNGFTAWGAFYVLLGAAYVALGVAMP